MITSPNNMLGEMHRRSTFEKTRAPLVIRVANRGSRWLEKIFRGRRPCASAPDLIDAAKRRTGLEDFGGGEFFEPLSRLLESCHRDAHLNLIGRIALRAEVTHTLCNRLLIECDRKENPEIAAQEIRAPLFIVGLPRSGTTLLHILMAADPANRTPLTWEVMTPSPPSDFDRVLRIKTAQRNLAKLRWLAPTFETVHSTGAELPQECVSLMSPSFLSDQFDTMFQVPTYRSWFLRQDQRPAYEFHRRFLQHLQQRERRQRWILKAPAHMFGINALLNVYPDALFVQTHRDPTEALTSVSSLIAILRAVFSDRVDTRQIGRDAMEYWVEALANFARERERLPTERVLDLKHQEIRHDPIGAMRRVYHYFRWPISAEIESRMREALARQSVSRAHGSHRYRAAQFGIDRSDWFESYNERFGLRARDKRQPLVGLQDAAEHVPPG